MLKIIQEILNSNLSEELKQTQIESIITAFKSGGEISKFEEGIKISKQCNKILEDAEKKITILLEKDGEVKEENFVSEE